MKQFLVVWLDIDSACIDSVFVDSARIFFAADDAMYKVVEKDPQLWKNIVDACTYMEIHEVWTS